MGTAHDPPRGDRRAGRGRARTCSRSARRVTARSSTRSRAASSTPSRSSCPPGADVRPAVGRAPRRGIHPSLTLRAAQATSFETFREAVLGLECPGQNVVYADVDGTIGYACTGRFPVRRAGDGTAPVPGWTAEHEWDGWIPPRSCPGRRIPGAASSSPRTTGSTTTAYPAPDRPRLPHAVPGATDRRASSRRTTAARSTTWCALQLDTVSLPAREIVPLLLALEPHTEDGARERLELLRAWDGDMSAGSAAAAVFNVVVAPHRAPHARAAPGRGPVPPLPRVARALPVPGPAVAPPRAGRTGSTTTCCAPRSPTRIAELRETGGDDPAGVALGRDPPAPARPPPRGDPGPRTAVPRGRRRARAATSRP